MSKKKSDEKEMDLSPEGDGEVTGREGEGSTRAPDGLPKGGNRDDTAERDMGLRDDSVMGATPNRGDVDGAEGETTEDRLKRLEKENAALRKAIEGIVPRETRKLLEEKPKRGAARGQQAAGEVAGEGPVEYVGYLHGNALFHAPRVRKGQQTQPFRFKGPENEDSAKAAFLRLNGIRSTTGKVVVRRAGEYDAEQEDGDREPKKNRKGK